MSVTAQARVVLYTAIFGDCDMRPPELNAETEAPAICFSDRSAWWGTRVGPWEVWPSALTDADESALLVDPCRWRLNASRYRARWHKLLGWLLLPAAKWRVWLDGNIIMRWSVLQLVDYLDQLGRELVVYRHHQRDCLYAEAETCARLGLDQPEILRRQTETYRAEGFPEHCGLVETSVLARRDTPEIRGFCADWWRELCRFSFRDQVSFNYLIWKRQLSYGTFPGTIWSRIAFAKRSHWRRTPAQW